MNVPESSATQRDLTPDIVAELDVAGFTDAVEIGRGGFGVVYRAEQQALGRTVAVKVLSGHLDAESRERFLREEQAMGRLSGHPNIVDILQVDVTVSGRPYIVMPYHARGSLEGLIRRGGPLTWQQTVRLGVKLAGGIETAHRIGILHRDVKPANVLLTAYEEPQLTDFGVARMSGGFETGTNTITGSPAFTAPEVLKSEPPTIASDIYGLGATLFAVLTGHAAFERRSGEKIVAQFLRITTEPVPDLRAQGIPMDVAAAIEAAMTAEPVERPATAAEFGELLRAVQAGNGMAVDDMALLVDGAPARAIAHPSATPTPGRAVTGATGRRGRDTVESPVTPPRSASTKYRPAVSKRTVLGRRRLIEVLRAGEPRRLTVIHGPAGTGKATLAAQWFHALAADGVPVAWLHVDDDDNNVVWFLAHLVEAIGQVRPDLGSGMERELEERPEDAEKYLLSMLIDDVGACGEPVVVVIDDWHRISDQRTWRALEQLLDSGGDQLRLVVTSAHRAGLPLSRMRVRDDLVEIDWQQLSLTLEETNELLLECNRLDLSDVAVAVLHATTEGWMAALQLASLSLVEHEQRGQNGMTEVIGGLTARRIDEYIAENIVGDLEPKMIEFLMSIAIVEQVNGELASILAEVDDGQAMLEEAEERDLFLRRLDVDPQWFRLHQMFADYLRRRCRREHPGLDRVLHLRASEWLAQHKQMDEAVDHALAAADPNRAAVLVESGSVDALDHPRLAALLGLVAKLPKQGVVPRATLMMAVARANVALRRSDTVRSALNRIDRMLDRRNNDD